MRNVGSTSSRKKSSAVVIQSPNFFGVIEDLQRIGGKVHGLWRVMIVGFSEAVAYGILQPPGETGS